MRQLLDRCDAARMDKRNHPRDANARKSLREIGAPRFASKTVLPSFAREADRSRCVLRLLDRRRAERKLLDAVSHAPSGNFLLHSCASAGRAGRWRAVFRRAFLEFRRRIVRSELRFVVDPVDAVRDGSVTGGGYRRS